MLALGDACDDGAGEVELVEGHDDVGEVIGVGAEDSLVLKFSPVRDSPGVLGVEHVACLGGDDSIHA